SSWPPIISNGLMLEGRLAISVIVLLYSTTMSPRPPRKFVRGVTKATWVVTPHMRGKTTIVMMEPIITLLHREKKLLAAPAAIMAAPTGSRNAPMMMVRALPNTVMEYRAMTGMRIASMM